MVGNRTVEMLSQWSDSPLPHRYEILTDITECKPSVLLTSNRHCSTVVNNSCLYWMPEWSALNWVKRLQAECVIYGVYSRLCVSVGQRVLALCSKVRHAFLLTSWCATMYLVLVLICVL